MPEQREAIKATVDNSKLTEKELTEQEKLELAIRKRVELKQGLRAILLERSAVSTALQVDLPPEVHGEWVRNDPLRIKDARGLGFDIDKTYAPKQALHDARADGSAVVGDLIFMTCPKENKELIDEIRAEEYIRRHGKPGEANKETIEERAFLTEQKTLSGSHISSVNESRATPVVLSVDKKEE